MLQQEQPEDFVLATGETTTVREFVELAFAELDMPIKWEGSGVKEIGRDQKSGKIIIEVSPEFFRPAEVDLLIGDASKAKEKLGWHAKTDLKGLVRLMVKADVDLLEPIEKYSLA